MTREEKEQTGEYVLQMARLLEDGCYQQEMLLKAVHIIDEALEQEPIIDKIRAEIIARDKNVKAVRSDSCCFFTAEEVLEIVDKCKAENEDNNAKHAYLGRGVKIYKEEIEDIY